MRTQAMQAKQRVLARASDTCECDCKGVANGVRGQQTRQKNRANPNAPIGHLEQGLLLRAPVQGPARPTVEQHQTVLGTVGVGRVLQGHHGGYQHVRTRSMRCASPLFLQVTTQGALTGKLYKENTSMPLKKACEDAPSMCCRDSL